MNKKFIVTQNQDVAKQLIAAGFNLVSNVAGVWTFQNIAPHNFNFDKFDKKQIAYTNILSI